QVEAAPLLQAVVLPRVNLLPPEIAIRRTFQQVQMGLGGAVLAAVGLVALLYVGATGAVSDAQSDLDTKTADGQALQVQTAKYRDVTATYARAAAAQAMLTQAMGEEVRWSRYLNDLSLTVPDNVWVKNVSFTQSDGAAAPAAAGTAPGAVAGIGTATFTGVGFAHDDVAVWLESLAKQKGYANPYFANSTEALVGSRKVVNFTSTTTLTPAALSGRYTAPAGG
ncbi:MAG: Fimbrial assembly family protein, partial [Frankiales bacterium]|nr:Fimbrial assembly family protein [Frankiales bacterium]